MPSISVDQNLEPWVFARWVFRGYLDHVCAEVRDDVELTYVLEEALALDGLHLPLGDATMVQRLGPILLRVAEDVVNGKRLAHTEERVLDERSQAQFRCAVALLRSMLAVRWSHDGLVEIAQKRLR